MKDYRGVRIEYHILQSFPVTCLNRDDVGMPKTARVGGVERSRVSSQCWKRQVRLALKDSGNIIPGHGGMLDRFDSALFAIPMGVIYLMVYNIIW